MGKYKIEDFAIGDTVYHLSNTLIMMVVIDRYMHINEVECRWLTKSGEKQIDTFLAEELGKKDDLRPKIRQISI
ncbi:hypothetical protein [Pedobacter mendelii]|uniref:Uncharacterized protein n=1 Tax=Pedobacter mendelii TaxID=1908240 RepID=A0ABQ2BDI8_9SPHI|nr:hypothetical protein [Pedobacter mendelii]GGI23649.1 hypothetical protein GCM10008119_08700 [Pedobacter mendelii]